MQETIEGYRLSPQQKRLWIVGKDDQALQSQCAVVVSGVLNEEALRRSLSRVIGRYEILRTTFRCMSGMEVPIQVIGEESDYAYAQMDRLADGEDEVTSTIDELMKEQRGRRHEVDKGQVLNVLVCNLCPATTAMIVSTSAMCSDVEGLRNLVREVLEAYDGDIASDEVVQYVDYAEWHNELLAGPDAAEGKEFWSIQKADETPALRLPFEAIRVTSSEVENPSHSFKLDPGLCSSIEAAARTLDCAEELFLLASWFVLLKRLTQSSDLAVGNLYDGRRIQHLRKAIGSFAGYLPLKCHLENHFTFDEVVDLVGEEARSAYSRQEYFVPELSTDEAGSALPPIGFQYDRLPQVEETSGGLKFSIYREHSFAERFKLRLAVVRRGAQLEFELKYDPAIYASTSISRLAEQFHQLLGAVTENHDRELVDLNVVGEAENDLILNHFNSINRAYPGPVLIHELIEHQAELKPDSIAVEYEDQKVSYGELNRRANQLGHFLTNRRVGLEEPVAIAMGRSVGMIVSVLGVWKAGGAYVPIDVSQPQDRMNRLLTDAGVRVVLCSGDVTERITHEGVDLVDLDGRWDEVANESEKSPEVRLCGNNLAYMIYTSGSTGEPKAVMIEHRSVANLSWALEAEIYLLGRLGRISMNAPLAFDGGVKQLVQLCRGRTLVIVPDEVRRDGEEMASFVDEKEIEVLDSTPSQMKTIIGAGAPRFRALKKVLLGGEAIEPRMWEELAQQGAVEHWNLYGPTECTVDATARLVGTGEEVSIGQPLSNVNVYILDEAKRLAPLGVRGEIAIGGAGVGRGYRNSGGRTAEKYVPNPFSDVAGGRLYLTGDIGKWRENGTIEYVGRVDGQVKVRGNRIELGEIESVLREHETVKEAVVEVRPDAIGEARLVAYVVPKREYAQLPIGTDRWKLPNGMTIAQDSRNDTPYLYEEIFERRCYMQHGIRLGKNACVFDVGANIGMFSLFMRENYPDARVYAFEPIRPIYEIAKKNMEMYCPQVKLYEVGLSTEEKWEEFTYYPEYSARSGLSEYADAGNEKEVVRTYLENQYRSGVEEVKPLLEELEDFVEFKGEKVRCRLRRLSEVIREEGIERIDLLKVDVQRAELDVLKGIDEGDWEKIDQITMEVHDEKGGASEGRIEEMRRMLEERGYEVVAEQDELLMGTDRHNLFAVKRVLAVEQTGVHVAEAAPLARKNGTGDSPVLHRLPNGLEVFYQNRNETDHIYKQIFEERVYMRNGIQVRDGDCVVDVGANIGLFVLFAHQNWPNARLYAFEPVPQNYEVLRNNVLLYGVPAKLCESGLSNLKRKAMFTYYPNWSASSGLYADVREETEDLRIYLRNQGEMPPEDMEEIIGARFEGVTTECELTTISDVIRDNGIERIDLLKIDVEKSELDVLDGIEEADWAKIRQIVMEAHDIGGRVSQMAATLKAHGFRVIVEQESALKGSSIYNVFAMKPDVANHNSSAFESQKLSPGDLMKPGAMEALLRSYVRESLPEYMVPSAIVLMEKFPLTRNGKIDRRALPEPEEKTGRGEVEGAQAGTQYEELLAGIWADVLGVAGVGVDSNFFDLGGHSLLATQLMSRIRKAFGIELPLRALFEEGDIRGLARRIEECKRTGAAAPGAVVRASRDRELPLSFAQQRLLFLHQLEPQNPSYNCPAAVKLEGSLNEQALDMVLTEVVRRHEVLRTRFEEIQGRTIQVIEESRTVEVPVIDLRGLQGRLRELEVERLAGEDANLPFDLRRGPVLRATLIKLAEQEHVLLFNLHHIVSDAWSVSVLIHEVASLYEAYSSGQDSPLQELEVQYADYAVWQRDWLQGEVLENQMAYWKSQLGGKLPVLELPTDRPRPAIPSYRGARYPFELTQELSEAVKALSRREGSTLFMTMLAALQTLLYRYTGDDDILIGADIANRNRSEVEKLIGFFINMLVMRSDLSGNPSFTALLGQVRETAFGAFAHQDLPFEKLVEELRPGRGQNHSPLFRVVLVFQNTPKQVLTVQGLTFTDINMSLDVARFDLTLCIQESSAEIRGYWAYSTDLFDRSTISEMHSHFETLLQSIANDPETRVRDLEIFSDQHRQQRLLLRQQREGANSKKLRSVKRKGVDIMQPPPVPVDSAVNEGHL